MAPVISARRSLRVALETGGFGVDPSSDGSGYTNVKTDEVSFVEDQTALLDGRYQVGRNVMSKREVGPDGAQITFQTPLQGYGTAIGDGSSPGSDDWLDILLNHCFGDSTDVDGDAVSATGSSTLSLTDDPLNSQFDLAPVYESGVNSSLMQWRRTAGASSPYATHRDWDEAPTASAICYGHRLWMHSDVISRSTLAAYVLMDDTPYVLLGGGVTQLSIAQAAGQKAVVSWTAMFDNKTQSTKASAPVFTSGTIDSGTPLQGELAELEFNGTVYAAGEVSVEFNLETSPVASVAGSNGRGDMKAFAVHPVVTFTPQFQTGLETAFRAGTTGKALVRFGGGALSGGAVNTLCFYMEAAQVDAAPNAQEDGPLIRQSVTLRAVDPGLDGSANAYPYWALARA